MKKIVEKIDDRLLYYERTLERCKGYILSSSRTMKPAKCLRCGSVFAYPDDSSPAKCPSCYGDQIVDATPSDVAEHANKYCWSLYGKYIAYLRVIRYISEKICSKKIECEFREASDEMEIHIEKYTRYLRFQLETSKGSILVNAKGVNYEILDLISMISKAVLEKREILLDGGITYIYYLTYYEYTDVGHETLVKEGFLDLTYYRRYLESLGYGIYGASGSIAKIIDLRKGAIIAPTQI